MSKTINHLAPLMLLLLAPAAAPAAPRVTLSGGSRQVITLDAERSSGLEAVFVVDASASDEIAAVYSPYKASAPLTWSRFSSRGGGFAEVIEGANSTTLTGLTPGMGYIVEEDGRQTCFWVVNYAASPFAIESVGVGEADCSSTTLLPDGTGERMTYYSVNGRAIEINREITVSFSTLAYDAATHSYALRDTAMTVSYLSPELHIPAPLCDTRFTLEGDRFLRQWGLTASATSPSVRATAVEATVNASQQERDGGDNEQSSGGGDGLGGSAPATIDFVAAVTDAALFTEWQMADSPDFDHVTLRFSEPEISYTFRETGTTFVRFVCANDAGSCEYTSEPFTVAIGQSDLKCPNAFSPNGDGVNDQWRVSYRSLISFECHIFSRSGKQMAHLTDPSQGWDGKGARPGTYYYVIRAEGSDGKKYNLSGDINIIGYN